MHGEKTHTHTKTDNFPGHNFPNIQSAISTTACSCQDGNQILTRDSKVILLLRDLQCCIEQRVQVTKWGYLKGTTNHFPSSATKSTNTTIPACGQYFHVQTTANGDGNFYISLNSLSALLN